MDSTTSNSLTLPSMSQSRLKSYRIATKAARGGLFRPTYILKLKKTPKRINSTSTDALSGGAWCNRITKEKGYHSTTPADKQINE